MIIFVHQTMLTSPETDNLFCAFISSFIDDFMNQDPNQPTYDLIYNTLRVYINENTDIEEYINECIEEAITRHDTNYVVCRYSPSPGTITTTHKYIKLELLKPLVEEYVNTSKFNIFNWDFEENYNQQRRMKSQLMNDFKRLYPNEGPYDYCNQFPDIIDDIFKDIFTTPKPFNWDTIIQQWWDCEHDINGSTGHAISDSTIDN